MAECMSAAKPAASKAAVRRSVRFQVDVPIRVIVQKETKVVILDGRGSSLNEGGMAVYAGAEFKLGDQIAVEFTPAYSPPIRVEAKVCNRTGYTYGLEFLTETSTQQEQAAKLRNHLATLTDRAES
jgi:hypothetical protein